MNCFDSILLNSGATCEISAVTIVNGQWLVASDKEIPGHSSVFMVDPDLLSTEQKPQKYLDSVFINDGRKYESLTHSTDGKWLFLATAFDRYNANGSLDAWNRLLVWPINDDSHIQLLESNHEGTASLALRNQLQTIIGQPYFKIEGLAWLPDNRLVFGVRESGDNAEQFHYRLLLIEARLEQNDSGAWHISQINPLGEPSLTHFALPEQAYLGVSSLTWDVTTQKLLLTASYEIKDSAKRTRQGGYLFSYDLKDKTVELLKDSRRQFLQFGNKPEGIDFIDNQHLLVVFDDDRKTDTHIPRELHQSAYTIIELNR